MRVEAKNQGTKQPRALVPAQGPCSANVLGQFDEVATRTFVILALLLGTSLLNQTFSQTTTSGALTGVITDPSKALVPDADVEIVDDAKGTTHSTKTGSGGRVSLLFFDARKVHVDCEARRF